MHIYFTYYIHMCRQRISANTCGFSHQGILDNRITCYEAMHSYNLKRYTIAECIHALLSSRENMSDPLNQCSELHRRAERFHILRPGRPQDCQSHILRESTCFPPRRQECAHLFGHSREHSIRGLTHDAQLYDPQAGLQPARRAPSPFCEGRSAAPGAPPEAGAMGTRDDDEEEALAARVYSEYLTKWVAVACLQEFINYDLILKDAGTYLLGTPFPELKAAPAVRVLINFSRLSIDGPLAAWSSSFFSIQDS